MVDPSSYNLVIIGAGIGGYPAAIRAAQLGAKVLIVDRSGVGGTCLNRGCIPTKALKASSDVLALANNAGPFGLTGEVRLAPDIKRIVDRKNAIVSELVKGVEFLFKSHGVTYRRADAAFESNNRLTLTSRPEGKRETVESDRFIIATGSSPAALPGIEPDHRVVLTSDDILDIDTLPKRLIIIGAGVIGIEFAFIFKNMGVDITVLEVMPRVLPAEDEDISALIARSLKKSGVTCKTGVKVSHVDVADDTVSVSLESGEVLTADRLLVSIGRKINTGGIGLETIGVGTGARKEILVDRFLSTGVRGIYACGDAIGGKMLAHVAYREGMTAAANLLEDKRQTINYDAIPSAIYSDPEAASVGVTEKDARGRGIAVKVGRFPYRALGKAKAFSKTEGEVKIVVDAENDRVLGMHIVGEHATDVIAQGAMAIQNGLTARALMDTVAAHPTYAEAVMEAAEDVFSLSIHQPKKRERN